MKLYMVPLAPNPTKVMLYIAERAALGTQMPIEQIVVNTVKGRQREPAHLARNPFGTLQAALQFLRFIEAHLFGDRPRLRAWDESYRQREAARAVLKW